MAAKSRFSSRLGHVAIVVKDLDKTIKRLEALGIGPFKPYDFSVLSPLVSGPLFHGKPYKSKIKIFVAKIGDISLEIFEHVEGVSPYKEFLDKKGEGIHHLGFVVDDLDGEAARFIDQGATVLHSARQEDGGGAYYLELGVPDIIFELEKLF